MTDSLHLQGLDAARLLGESGAIQVALTAPNILD